MKDEDIKKLFKRLAELYELELETARTLLAKIINTIYGEERNAEESQCEVAITRCESDIEKE